MDGVEIGLRAVGAFYAFAGYVATRSALMSSFLDGAIAAIGGSNPNRAETARTTWLLVSALVVFAGGVALIGLLDVAAWLFVLSALGQVAYLGLVAPRYFDRDDPPDEVGRRQTTNASVIYLAATAFVVWALWRGKLVAWSEMNPGVLAVIVAAIVLHVGHTLWTWSKGPSTKPLFGASAPTRDPAHSYAIKVMADYHTHPLWGLDEDAYGDIAPEALDLSPELRRDLHAWADAYSASLNEEDPTQSLWSDEQHAAHAAQARPLAIRLARERPDRMIYVMDSEIGVVEVKPDEVLPSSPGGAKV